MEEEEAKVALPSSVWEGRWGFSEGRFRRRFLGSIVAIVLFAAREMRDEDCEREDAPFFYWVPSTFYLHTTRVRE